MTGTMMSEEEEGTVGKKESPSVEVFVEQCSSLYNLILDQLNDDLGRDPSEACRALEAMAAEVLEAGRKLSAENPDLDNGVQLRIHTISSAMEQLRLRRTTSDCESIASHSSPFFEIRAWIHRQESRLEDNRTMFRSQPLDAAGITKLLADQQVLQCEIHYDGLAHFQRLTNYVARSATTVSSRRQHCVEGLRRRWHELQIASISLQCAIEDARERAAEEAELDSDPDWLGPPIKRRRLRAGVADCEEDEEEEEHFDMDDNRTATATSGSLLDEGESSRKWTDTSGGQADIGYSSGEASAHDRLSPEGSTDELPPSPLSSPVGIATAAVIGMQRRVKKVAVSPVKPHYQMSATEGSDNELIKDASSPFAANLTDSLIVNHEDSPMKNSPEFDEILAMLDEEDDGLMPRHLPNGAPLRGTQWREMRGRISPRASLRARKKSDEGKASCDASSEDSSEWEGGPPSINAPDPFLTSSMHSAFSMGDFSLSLKRPRGSTGRLNVSMLASTMSSEMDASFCSTRSEMPGGRNRGLRKKIRVRRLPRSMSDGEQLGISSAATEGMSTPFVRVSPPRTPLATSISLLRRLEADLTDDGESSAMPITSTPLRGGGMRLSTSIHERLRAEESGGEESAAYEWDDYHPPEKDDSFYDDSFVTAPSLQGSPLKSMDRSASDLLSVDEDFSRQLGSKNSLPRLVEESKAHLAIVQETLMNSEINEAALNTISLIARTNVRHLQEAFKTVLPKDIKELAELETVLEEWQRVASPLPRLAFKVRHFAQSLRSLGVETSLPTGGIHTKEQARIALETLEQIEIRFRSERDELRNLLSCSGMQKELAGMEGEFCSLTTGYDEAIGKIEGLVSTVRKLDEDWGGIAEQQKAIRELMQSLEYRLKSEGTALDAPAVIREMELCQERMNSLETMCNYLSSHLAVLQEAEACSGSAPSPCTLPTPEFASEIMLYANAIEQLKRRVTEALHIPPAPECPLPESNSKTRRRRASSTQTKVDSTKEESPTFGRRIVDTVKQSKGIQILLLLSALCALCALLAGGVFSKPFGPHLEYVRGPPPT